MGLDAGVSGAVGAGSGAGGGITDFVGTGVDFLLRRLNKNSIIGIEAMMYFQDFFTHKDFLKMIIIPIRVTKTPEAIHW